MSIVAQNQRTVTWAGKIHVEELRRLDKPGNVRAYVTIGIGSALKIHGCKIVQQPGQKAWVALPQTQSGGRWYPVVSTDDKALTEEIGAVVLAAWTQQAGGAE